MNRESQETWEYEKGVQRTHGNIDKKSQETWEYRQGVPRNMGI